MCSLEASREGSHGFLRILRADKSGRNQGINASDTIRPGPRSISHLLQRVLSPLHSRMPGAECISELKLVEIKSNEIAQRGRLDAIEIVDRRLVILYKRWV